MIHASLFSGIGGPEVAAAMLGWENAFHCEINPFGRAVLEYWFPESKSYEDITKTDFTEWRGKIDVLTGGFPCQPFSYAGKRGGREDERYLWPQMLRVIDEIRPTWVVGENVAGITTMVEGGVLTPMGCDTTLFGEGDGLHRYELRQSFTIERICRDLEGLGYSVQPMLIPAASVGAPHRRDRIFILAHVADTDCGYDLRGSGEDEGKGKGKGLSERHSIRKSGESNQLRSEVQGIDAFSYCGGSLSQRKSGSSEGNRGKRVQIQSEWGQQAQQYNGLSPLQRVAEDPIGNGRAIGESEVEGRERNFGDISPRNDQRICREKRVHSADTYSRRGGEVPTQVYSGKPDGNEPLCDGSKWAPADPSSEMCDRRGAQTGREWEEDSNDKEYSIQPPIIGSRSERIVAHANCGGQSAPTSDSGFNRKKEIKGGERNAFAGTIRPCSSWSPSYSGLLPENRWANFPTVPPVHAGNDGLPIRMDGISIPFTKWRTEALKAYGNAIVPQVMYRIFQAIESCQ